MTMFLDAATEATGNAGAQPTSFMNILSLIIPFALIAVVFYFFMIRPQKKQEKENAQMRDNLQVGDEVTTIGGIIGRVVSIKDETFTLETSRDRTKMRFLRSAIRSVDVKATDIRAAVSEKPADEKPAENTKKPAKKKAEEAKPAEKESVPAEENKENTSK
ncbi:MAG: preprotein translocase subunit YajC [Eubacteriales bacterium]